MFRTLSALALGTALAVAPVSATPARADANDVGKVIAGATALFIIGKVIKDRNDRKKEKQEAARRDNDYGRHDRDWRDRDGRWNHGDWRDHDRGRDHGRREARARVLPSSCLRKSGGYGNQSTSWVGAECLQRNNVSLSRLPQQCQSRVRFYGRIETAYEPRCLIRSGYSFSFRGY